MNRFYSLLQRSKYVKDVFNSYGLYQNIYSFLDNLLLDYINSSQNSIVVITLQWIETHRKNDCCVNSSL